MFPASRGGLLSLGESCLMNDVAGIWGDVALRTEGGQRDGVRSGELCRSLPGEDRAGGHENAGGEVTVVWFAERAGVAVVDVVQIVLKRRDVAGIHSFAGVGGRSGGRERRIAGHLQVIVNVLLEVVELSNGFV